jgi:hypothetical protein
MGKGGGLSPQVQAGELANSNALTQIAQQQASNSQQLFNTAYPGFGQAESFYSQLASGSPSAIATAISPAVQQIGQATQGSIANIMNNDPSGGEKNLALEQARVAQGAQVGQAATGSFLNSFNALAGLAGQGVGQSISAAGTGISGYNSANQGLGQLGQLQVQQKGAQLGAIGGLLNAGATVGAAAL